MILVDSPGKYRLLMAPRSDAGPPTA